MLYLFDANVLITAEHTYYPIDQIPEFWEWLQFQGQAGKIKLPLEIMEEILAGKKHDDPLLAWMNQQAFEDDFGGPRPFYYPPGLPHEAFQPRRPRTPPR